jgi:hypothetical protein
LDAPLTVDFENGTPPRLLQRDEPNPGFSELCRVVFMASLPGPWELQIDDERVAPEGVVQGRWAWSPGFFAGEVLAKLIHLDTGQSTEYRLDVSPDGAKVGRDIFLTMLRELWVEAPDLVAGTEPALDRMGTLGASEDPYLAFCRLRQHGASFLSAMKRVTCDPIRTLRYHRMLVPLRAVRRADARTAATGLRDPFVAAVLTGRESTSEAPAADLNLDAPVVEQHLDNAANRCLVAMVRAVLRRIEHCRVELGKIATSEKNPGDTRTSVAARWPVREGFLIRMRADLERLVRRFPLSEVSRPEVTPAGLNAIAAHPVYSRAYGRGWRCIRRGLTGDPSEDEVPLSPTWEVYERWTFFKLIEFLRTKAGLSASASPIHRSLEDRCRWTGRMQDGSTIRAFFQHPFSGGPHGSNRGFLSISGRRIPDIVLTVEGVGEPRFVVLDAKYRRTRSNVLEAMESAHIYHDSLRWNGRPPDQSLLLVPAGGGAPWLQDPGFHHEHAVGVVVVSPGSAQEGLTLLGL